MYTMMEPSEIWTQLARKEFQIFIENHFTSIKSHFHIYICHFSIHFNILLPVFSAIIYYIYIYILVILDVEDLSDFKSFE